MKIGILTQPIETNYGGILQAYALQEVLRRLGHNVSTINIHIYPMQKVNIRYLLDYIKRNIKHYVLGNEVSTKFKTYLSKEDYERTSINIKPFIQQNIKLTRPFEELKSLNFLDEFEFDAIVVGSDQVWIPTFCPEYFLSFAESWDIKRVAYAASFGHTEWRMSEEITYKCKRLAQKFSSISVREESGIDLCKKYLGVEAKHVLDPTMLLTADDYLNIIKYNSSRTKTLFSYVLDSTIIKKNVVKQVAEYLSLEIFSTLDDSGITNKHYIVPPIDDWICGIKNSQFVVTDSFHGTVFSILFNKPFIVLGNRNRGMARFESLLKLFNIEERLVYDLNNIRSVLSKEIDYQKINQKIEILRLESLNFISSSLH